MPTFDAEKALEQIDGDKELLSILLGTFTRVTPKQIEQLHGAIEERDAEELAAVAHCLKGSLGLFGAEPAAEIARQLEANAREGNFHCASATLAHLDAECTQLARDLADFLHSAK